MAPNFPIDESYLVGGWLESFLWGLYTLLFGMSIHTIYQKRELTVWRLTTVSIVTLYILASTHMILALVRLIQGFIFYRDTIGPVKYFADIPVPINKAKDYVYITSLFIGDLVVVWRLYVVWGQSLHIAALPIVMIFGELIAGYGSLIQYELPNPNPLIMVHWGTAMFAMSLATNIVVTAAVAGRIYVHYTRLILLIIESGSIITAAKLIEFVLFLIVPGAGGPGLNALYIVYETMPQITGIVPTMIIYAVNNGFTHREEEFTTNWKSSLFFNKRVDASSTVVGANSEAYMSEPLSTSTLASPSIASMSFSPNEELKRQRKLGEDLESEGIAVVLETV
ncbi:hypothetical protein C8Q74DRAFT_1363904 [Fomes fomentarius]|nr:hypothetical protein C8Q74DRAFT_1363904 [Fomes fomentarius]